MAIDIGDSASKALAHNAVPRWPESTIHKNLNFCVRALLLSARKSCCENAFSYRLRKRSATNVKAWSFMRRYISSLSTSIPVILFPSIQILITETKKLRH
jgi:hypothetical protein